MNLARGGIVAGRTGKNRVASIRRRTTVVTIGLSLLSLLLHACATDVAQSKRTYFDQKKNELVAGLDACMGRSKGELIMELASPIERLAVEDGEIWIYKYRRAESETKATGTGTGALLNPYEEERRTVEKRYELEVKLLFDRAGVAQKYSYWGHLAAFDTQFHSLGRKALQKK